MQRSPSPDDFPFLGADLALDHRHGGGFWEDADLRAGGRQATGRRDLATVAGLDNLQQALIHRLKTHHGELAALGHPEFGSRHHELIGEPNTERTRNLIKLRVLQALRREPRVTSVLRLDVRPAHRPPRDTVRIEAELEIIDQPEPLALVVPFSLVGPAEAVADETSRSVR
ncbi:MAG: GPW/gp25 family protein [Acidobacteriota bacterium]